MLVYFIPLSNMYKKFRAASVILNLLSVLVFLHMVVYFITLFSFLNASVYMVIFVCCLNDVISLNDVLFVTGVVIYTSSLCLGSRSAEMIVCRVNPRGRCILTRIAEVYRGITRSSFRRIW